MFISKVLPALALVVIASAQHEHHATSYASINNFNTHITHEQIAPVLIKSAPIVHVAPVHHQAPAPIHQSAPLPDYHAAPIALKAAPVEIKAVSVVKTIHHEEEHYAPAKYQFKYGVEDKKTHDIKSQEESRDGDVVKGYYSLLQPDGRTRIVHYTADKHSGFQAQVEYSGHASHPEVEHKAAPIYHH